MSLEDMLLYVEFVADNLLANLCQKKIHNAKNPVRAGGVNFAVSLILTSHL